MTPRTIQDRESSEDYEEEEDNDEDDSIRNPILQLHNSQDTLETLTVRWCDTFSDFGVLYEPRYPNLKELTLAMNEFPSTAHHTRAFPNLATLNLEEDPREYAELGTEGEIFRDHRLLNKFGIYQHGTWASLKAVRAPLVDHFLLRLISPVERMHVMGNFFGQAHAALRPRDDAPRVPEFRWLRHLSLLRWRVQTCLLRGSLFNAVRAFETTLFIGGLLEPEQVTIPHAPVSIVESSGNITQDALVERLAQMSSIRSFGLTINCIGLRLEAEIVGLLLGL
ncbi:hypothetical protein BC628DRAFT_1395881 [Trametes gibbosa]|nr:hypothetical protein BC628DRAFT_1395881 [Trametes gibbosa]